jgi:hypothetical protein
MIKQFPQGKNHSDHTRILFNTSHKKHSKFTTALKDAAGKTLLLNSIQIPYNTKPLPIQT